MPVPLPGPWRYFARRNGNTELRWGWVHRSTDLQTVLTDLRSFDVYVHLNSTRGATAKPRTWEVTGWRTVLLDIDPDDNIPNNPGMAMQEVLDAANRLLGHSLNPTLLDSGRGCQAWITFPEVSPAPEWASAAIRGFLLALEKTVGDVVYGCRVDRSVSDLTRLGRAPGTFNQRTGRATRVLHIGREDPLFVEALTAWIPKSSATVRSLGAETWASTIFALPLLAATFLTEGVPKGDRHHAACNAAYRLRAHGVPDIEVLAALAYGNGLCDPPLEQDEIIRVWETTRRNP